MIRPHFCEFPPDPTGEEDLFQCDKCGQYFGVYVFGGPQMIPSGSCIYYWTGWSPKKAARRIAKGRVNVVSKPLCCPEHQKHNMNWRGR